MGAQLRVTVPFPSVTMRNPMYFVIAGALVALVGGAFLFYRKRRDGNRFDPRTHTHSLTGSGSEVVAAPAEDPMDVIRERLRFEAEEAAQTHRRQEFIREVRKRMLEWTVVFSEQVPSDTTREDSGLQFRWGTFGAVMQLRAKRGGRERVLEFVGSEVWIRRAYNDNSPIRFDLSKQVSRGWGSREVANDLLSALIREVM